MRNAQSAQLKQKRKEVHDGECAQKGTATLVVFTSPQQPSGNQSNPIYNELLQRVPYSESKLPRSKSPLLIKPKTVYD